MDIHIERIILFFYIHVVFLLFSFLFPIYIGWFLPFAFLFFFFYVLNYVYAPRSVLRACWINLATRCEWSSHPRSLTSSLGRVWPINSSYRRRVAYAAAAWWGAQPGVVYSTDCLRTFVDALVFRSRRVLDR